jgi:hypothetical protein
VFYVSKSLPRLFLLRSRDYTVTILSVHLDDCHIPIADLDISLPPQLYVAEEMTLPCCLVPAPALFSSRKPGRLESRNISNYFRNTLVFLLPAFQGNCAAGMLISGELPAHESLFHLFMPSISTVDNVREHGMAHHNEVDGAPQRKEVCLDIRIKRIVSRAVESARLATPAVKNHLTVLR